MQLGLQGLSALLLVHHSLYCTMAFILGLYDLIAGVSVEFPYLVVLVDFKCLLSVRSLERSETHGNHRTK